MTPKPAHRRWTWRGLAAVAGSIATALGVLFGAVWAASADRAGLERAVEAHGADLTDHEQRIRTVEREMHQIAADVQWIRRTMEHDQP